MGRSKLHYIKHTGTRKDSQGHKNMTACEQAKVKRCKLDTENEGFRFGVFLNVFINPAITSLEYTVIILLFILKLSDRFHNVTFFGSCIIHILNTGCAKI